MAGQRAELEWRDESVPVSTRFDDPYFSLENGWAETAHVFLAGNDLPARFADGFTIAELGFGTGLNALATLAAWEASGVRGALHYTSFEAYPMDKVSMARALAAFPQAQADRLLAVWDPAGTVMDLGSGMTLDVVVGDARAAVPGWAGQADAWFLDGFAPAKNPELWEPGLIAEVARHTAPGGTAATYTAAGAVRRALAEVGFAVERVPGYRRKRHMTRGVLL